MFRSRYQNSQLACKYQFGSKRFTIVMGVCFLIFVSEPLSNMAFGGITRVNDWFTIILSGLATVASYLRWRQMPDRTRTARAMLFGSSEFTIFAALSFLVSSVWFLAEIVFVGENEFSVLCLLFLLGPVAFVSFYLKSRRHYSIHYIDAEYGYGTRSFTLLLLFCFMGAVTTFIGILAFGVKIPFYSFIPLLILGVLPMMSLYDGRHNRPHNQEAKDASTT